MARKAFNITARLAMPHSNSQCALHSTKTFTNQYVHKGGFIRIRISSMNSVTPEGTKACRINFGLFRVGSSGQYTNSLTIIRGNTGWYTFTRAVPGQGNTTNMPAGTYRLMGRVRLPGTLPCPNHGTGSCGCVPPYAPGWNAGAGAQDINAVGEIEYVV